MSRSYGSLSPSLRLFISRDWDLGSCCRLLQSRSRGVSGEGEGVTLLSAVPLRSVLCLCLRTGLGERLFLHPLGWEFSELSYGTFV